MDKQGIPTRRKHGCDGCHKDVPTELFLGYNRNTLWICKDCYKEMIKGIKKLHLVEIWNTKKHKKYSK